MSKHYFSFGQMHTHRLNGVTLDCDGILCVEAKNSDVARKKVFDLIGNKFAFQYTEETLKLKYFPRGVVLTLEA